MVNAVSEVIGTDDKLADDIEAMMLESIDLFEELLERAVKQNEILKPSDIRATANAITAFLMGFKVIHDEKQLWNR